MLKRLPRTLLVLALVLGFVLLPVFPAGAAKRIADDGTLLEELAKMREMKAIGFQLRLKKSYFTSLAEDDLAGLTALFLSAGMTDYRLRYSTDGELTLDDVQWTEPHMATCSTEEEFREAVRELLSQGVSACQIIVKDENVFENLVEEKLAFLCCAMYGAEAVTIRTTLRAPYAFYLNDIRYYRIPWYVVSGEDAWLDTVREKAAENAEAFYLIPDPAFVEEVSADGEMLKRLESAGAAFEYLYTYSDSVLLKVRASARYPGTRIVNAVREKDWLYLNYRERETFSAAQELADECRRDDPLETARLIHDALCEKIVYTDDNTTDEDDNAIGALLNGRANCDGYADAFYLAGNLAGLEVQYQHGNGRRKEADESYSTVSHMWNLIRIDGSWRLVDVTWDDQEDRTVYTWFNIGADRARRTHVWDEEHSTPLLEKTDPTGRPENEYLVRDEEGIRSAVSDTETQGYDLFTLVTDEGYTLDSDAMLDCLTRAVHRSFSYSWNEYMRIMTVLYEP